MESESLDFTGLEIPRVHCTLKEEGAWHLNFWKTGKCCKCIDRSRSVLWAWAGSYVIVLFIPLITVFINYQINVGMIKQGIVNANELTLNNISDNINDLLEMEKDYHNYIFSNKNMEVLQSRSIEDKNFYNDVAQLYKELRLYRNGRDLLHAAVWLNDSDYIISDRTANKAEKYYDVLNYMSSDMMPYEEWRGMLEREYNNLFFIGPDIMSEQGRESLFYANTPMNTLGGKYTILISVELSELAKLTQYSSSDTFLILSIDGEPAAAFCQGKIVEIPGEQIAEADDSKWITLQMGSIEKNMTYLLLISHSTLWGSLQDTRESFALNVILTLTFGIIGTAILLRRNYRPVQELLSGVDLDIRGEGNEFQKISDVLDRLHRENLASQNMVNRQKSELLSSRLLAMMKGRTGEVSDKEMGVLHELDIRGEIGLVGFMLPVSDEINIQYDELLFFIVENIFEELTETKKRYRVENGRFLIYLFELQDETEDAWETYIMNQVEYLCGVLEEKWKLSLVAVISDVERGIDNIRFLYRKVMESFEYQNVVGGTGVISTHMLESQDERSFLMEYVRGELCDALREGDLERMLKASDKFFGNMRGLTFVVSKMYAFDAFTIVAEVLRGLLADDFGRPEVLAYAERLMMTRNAEELKPCFDRMLEFACSEIVLQYNQKSDSIVDWVKEYIANNYQDQNLSVSSIAETLRRNPKYLSRIFKENTGEGILDYVNSFRITRAKALLVAHRYTIEEVAELVGYTNVRTFRRTFTKLTGDIPSKYMKD